MTIFYDVLTAILAATMAGNEFAVAAFFHPQFNTPDTQAHAQVSSCMAAVLGRAMPPWYGVALALLLGAAYEHRPLTSGSGLLILCAAVLWAVVILVTIIMLVPINNRIARIDPFQPYATWLADRNRWDALHRVRVALLIVSVLLLLTGLLKHDASYAG